MEKSILITGCGSGIGLRAAEILKEKGYRVFATARKDTDVARLQSMGFESLQLDVNYSESIKKAITEILNKTGGTLYALFNNAGYGQTGAIDDVTREMMRKQFETNVFGPMELIKEVLPIMRKQGFGRIVQNTSILGLIAMPYYGPYTASKFALEALSNTLRQELWGTQIFVSSLVCGPVRSQFRENAYRTFHQSMPDTIIKDKRYEPLDIYFSSREDKHPPFTVPADVAVKQLIKALESKKPKAHYYVGLPAYLFAFLRNILSDSLLDWILIKLSQNQAKG